MAYLALEDRKPASCGGEEGGAELAEASRSQLCGSRRPAEDSDLYPELLGLLKGFKWKSHDLKPVLKRCLSCSGKRYWCVDREWPSVDAGRGCWRAK